MSRNSYLQIGQLAMHPAFSHREVALVCPLCEGDEPFTTMRFGEYTPHFLAHNPTQEQAHQGLDWKAYRRLAAKKGWQQQ